MNPAVSLDQYASQPYCEMCTFSPGFCCWKASAHFWYPGCWAESHSQYSIGPFALPPPPLQAVSAPTASATTAVVAWIRCLRLVMTSSLDPAEADGVDDAFREEHEQHQHRQGRDERGRHQPRPVRAGLWRLRLEYAE